MWKKQKRNEEIKWLIEQCADILGLQDEAGRLASCFVPTVRILHGQGKSIGKSANIKIFYRFRYNY